VRRPTPVCGGRRLRRAVLPGVVAPAVGAFRARFSGVFGATAGVEGEWNPRFGVGVKGVYCFPSRRDGDGRKRLDRRAANPHKTLSCRDGLPGAPGFGGGMVGPVPVGAGRREGDLTRRKR
jgi:hypothetical protein